MMAVAVVTGGIWVLIVLPLWKIALGALGIAVLLLVLTFVGIAAKAWHDKHTIF